VHPYPTYGDGVWTAASTQFRSRLARDAAARAVGIVRHARRRWLARDPLPDDLEGCGAPRALAHTTTLKIIGVLTSGDEDGAMVDEIC